MSNKNMMTAELLIRFSKSSLVNASELLAEATLLHDNGRYARAYFLSVACIEEAGKALMAFDAQGRNLADPAVCTKLRKQMECHASKIRYALGVAAARDPNPKVALESALRLIHALRNGREPSMYCDLLPDQDRVVVPSEAVRPVASADCLRLATFSIKYAQQHVINHTPVKVSIEQDKLFLMKPSNLDRIMNLEDFWWFCISQLQDGVSDVGKIILAYEKDYILNNKLFRSASVGEG